jgi:glycosyltransferase involved in cell wall biosynthesis
MIDVLIDMTALNTGSRERGIGRYVRNLCLTLAARRDWLEQYPALPGAALQLSGLIRHKGERAAALDPTLQFAGDYSIKTSSMQYQRHKLERRFLLGGLVNRVSCRLLHLPDPPGTPYDRRARRIVTCHDLIPLVLAKQYLSPLPGAVALQRARDKARYKSAARVIAISEATRRDLVEQLDIAPERIDVVHHGVDHERFSPSEAPGERALLAQQLGLDSPYFFYLGAGDVRKNLPLFVRAYAASGVARDVALVMAGPLSQRERATLLAVAAERGVADRLKLLGYVDEALIQPLYRQCLAHVFPSSYEGFGLPVLEAMACGAPTLTTAFSSLGEVAGDAALTLRELEVESFAAELCKLVEDAELRAELRRRGLLRVREFTWQRCAAKTLSCYQRALDEAGA